MTETASAAIASAIAQHPAHETAAAGSVTHAAAVADIAVAEKAEPKEEVKSAEVASATEAEPLVSLQDWCAAKSKTGRHVELVNAFYALEKAEHHLLDTAKNYEAAYEGLRTRPAK